MAAACLPQLVLRVVVISNELLCFGKMMIWVIQEMIGLERIFSANLRSGGGEGATFSAKNSASSFSSIEYLAIELSIG